MPRDIADEIAANRRQIGRSFARERRPSPDQETGLILSPIPVNVDATVEIYTRPINDTLIVGHPDAAQGVARGAVGDFRGSWTKQDSTTTSLNNAGQNAIADALVGNDSRLGQASVGDAVVEAFGLDTASKETTGRASFRFNQAPDPVTSGDLRTESGSIIAEGTVSDVAAGSQKEVRVDVILVFSDASRTDSESVTGADTVSDAIRTPTASTVTLADIALGTDDTKPTTSDTSLGNKTIQKDARAEAQGSRAVADTVLFRGEPGSQPVDLTELAVVDSNGDLVTRVVFAAQTKDDRLRLRVENGVVIR